MKQKVMKKKLTLGNVTRSSISAMELANVRGGSPFALRILITDPIKPEDPIIVEPIVDEESLTFTF